MKFVSIDPNKLRTATFKVVNKGQRDIQIDNKIISTTYIVVSIRGLPASIFHADFRFEKSSNLFLRSEMPQGPFSPITRIEILDK